MTFKTVLMRLLSSIRNSARFRHQYNLWMVVPCIWFEITVNYQLDANIVYFSSTCFGPIRSSSGAIEFIISFTNAAYGVLGAARCLEERARWW